MQGDPVIDKLMQPVITALMRHGIKGDAKTDIYNRAYESIMNSMVVMDTMREELGEANRRADELEMECVQTHHVHTYNWDGLRFAEREIKKNDKTTT